jgi:uncharacterized protein
MTPTPSAGEQGPTTAQVRRRLLGIGLGLFLPIIVIWFAAATVVAHGLQFPPALAYSSSGKLASGSSGAAASTRSLRELIDDSAGEITLSQTGPHPLRAFLAPAVPAEIAVVLIYPNPVNAQVLVRYFNFVRSTGYPVLMIDYDESRGFGYLERVAALDAVAALRARGVRRVALMGVSEGAAAVLFAGAEDAPISAIISDSSYADLSAMMRRFPPLDSLNPLFDRTVLWELGLRLGRPIADIAPAKAAAQIERPLLLINGADDPLVPPADAHKIYAAARGPKELWIVPDAGHASALAADPNDYTRRVSVFLARYLGPPTANVD